MQGADVVGRGAVSLGLRTQLGFDGTGYDMKWAGPRSSRCVRLYCTVGGTPLPPLFLQVLILQGVKVACFHTLLQVLILKNLRG